MRMGGMAVHLILGYVSLCGRLPIPGRVSEGAPLCKTCKRIGKITDANSIADAMGKMGW